MRGNRCFRQTLTARPKPDALPLQLQLKQTVDVSAEKLSPGSFLSVTAEATDDCYTGPQTNRSRNIIFGIVSPEELFREILLRQQAERIKFRKQTEEAEALRGSDPIGRRREAGGRDRSPASGTAAGNAADHDGAERIADRDRAKRPRFA